MWNPRPPEHHPKARLPHLSSRAFGMQLDNSRGSPLVPGVSDIQPEVEALSKALHDERVAASTQQIDCWACEAAKSPAVRSLMKALRKARVHAEHVEAILDRAVPDDEEQMELWRAHWHEQILRRRTS